MSKNTPPASIQKRTIDSTENVSISSKRPQVPKKSIVPKSNPSLSTVTPRSRGKHRRYSPDPQREEVEALVNIDRRTVIFEQLNTENDISHPIHQISWYQNTSVEDIENAIDEVVEIMEEYKGK